MSGWMDGRVVWITLPCPGGPKSQSPDAKPKSASCFESQCRDLELTKCCAALSKRRKSRVIIDTHLSFKKRYSLHGLASQVAYRLRDEMAYVMIVSL